MMINLDDDQASLVLKSIQVEMSIYKELVKKATDDIMPTDIDMANIADLTTKFSKLGSVVTMLAINGVTN